jgi:wyosine [tRNA(Phe)-imidazoG37] synthetase (radical SAM superfamily)
MSTILFEEIIFGPIHSRRLGTSLGINLLPLHGKLCSFDCLYCECGLNAEHKHGSLPKADKVKQALKTKLIKLRAEGIILDVITFAGNGEPTIHPEFERIVDDTILLRNQFYPKAKVSVLSNATQLNKPKVFSALLKIENPILKLDSALEKTVKILNRPTSLSYSIREQVERMKDFKGKLIIQTLFTRGSFKGQTFDNTSDTEVSAWIEILREISPKSTMIYAIDRETPVSGLEKITVKELKAIAKRLKDETGIPASVAG